MRLPLVNRRMLAALSMAVTLIGTGLATPAAAAEPAKGKIRNATTPTAIADSYIVVLKNAAVTRPAVSGVARRLAARHGGAIKRTYSAAIRGFEVTLSRQAAERLAADDAVAFVEQNQRVSIQDTQASPPSWGVDRVDQRNLPLDDLYSFPTTANAVHAYVIDTGIRFGHEQFGGRAVSGFDAVDGGTADDCNGHGTHVAGTIGGKDYGMAKDVTLVGVRVLGCAGSGSWAQVLAGIDWVTTNAVKPAVVNMSLGGPPESSIDDSVRASIASGLTYVLAAGNSAADACNSTPSRVTEAVTVAASAADDSSASFTNRGRCVDLYAPGVAIVSAYHTSDTATSSANGTSMAAPHVAGVAALYLQANPQWGPQQVHDAIVESATPAVVTGVPANTPNRLLFSGQVQPPANDFAVVASPAAGLVSGGESLTTTVSTTTLRGVDQELALSVSGLPRGVTATFTPAGVVSGGTSELTLTTTGETPAGRFPLRIVATGAGVLRSAPFLLTVAGTPGCSGADATPVSIPDAGSAVTSTIVVSGCPRNASSATTVTVDISHTWRGDLVLDLVAPDGSAYRIKNAEGGDSADDIRATFTVDVSGEAADGAWQLKVQDVASADVGLINSWSLAL